MPKSTTIILHVFIRGNELVKILNTTSCFANILSKYIMNHTEEKQIYVQKKLFLKLCSV